MYVSAKKGSTYVGKTGTRQEADWRKGHELSDTLCRGMDSLPDRAFQLREEAIPPWIPYVTLSLESSPTMYWSL